MRTRIPFLAVLLSLVPAMGCEEALEDTGGQPFFRDGVNNLTVMVYDAMTGAGIQGAALTVRVGPYALPAAAYDHVYTVSGIPAGTFPVFIEAEGYLHFVGRFTFTGTGNLTSPTQARTYYTRTAIMFPMDSVEEDVHISVYEGENGQPVAAGRLVATIDPTVVPQGIVTVTEDVLHGSLGLRPMSLTVDLSDGRATLTSEDLVFGATYKLDVIGARNSDGEYLQPVGVTGHRAGRDHPAVVLFMGPPAVSPVALTASNESGGTFTELDIVFPYPVEICSDPRGHTWLNESGDTNFNGVFAAPAADEPLTVSLTDGDEILTLTPNIEFGTRDEADRVVARIQGVGIRVAGTRGSTTQSCIPFEQVPLRNTGTLVQSRLTVQAGP